MKNIFISLLLLSTFAFAKLTITTTIPPIKYFVDKIVKNEMNVRILFKDSDLNFKHRQLQLKTFARADIYFTVGLEEEKKFEIFFKQVNPKLNIVDLSQKLNKLTNSKGEVNPYVWMDPLNVREIANAILKAVIALDPDGMFIYNKNHDEFLREIDELFLSIKKDYYTTSDSIFIFDDSWQYYTSRFSIESIKIDKRILKANEISEFSRKAIVNKTTAVLAKKGSNYRILKSISSNSDNARIIENDIFDYYWQSNLILLTKNLIGKKEEN